MPKKEDEFNPFVQSLVIKGVWKLDYKHKIMSSAEEGLTTYAQSRLIDGDDRTSVYGDGLLSWFPKLTSSAKDMFMYITIRLGYQKDKIELREDDYCAQMGIGRTTFFNARHELVDRLILPCKSRKHMYWVNPNYIFKGSRIEKFPKNIRPVNDDPLMDRAIEFREKEKTKSNYELLLDED